MNRAKENSIAYAIRSRIAHRGDDRLWTYADFPGIDRHPLSATLSRLAKTGEIRRVRRGVYYRPRTTLFGPSKPDPVALADAVLRARGEPTVPSGLGAYNKLGFTTQVSNVVARATLTGVAPVSVPGVRMHTTRRPLDRQKGIRPNERTALDALRDITRIPDAEPADVLRRIGTLVRAGDLDFLRLARFARPEPPRVRALLGALGERLRIENAGRRVPTRVLVDLHKGLNPLTVFRLRDVREALGSVARKWHLK